MRKLDCQTSLVSNTAAVCESITIDTAHGKQQRPSTESQRTSYKAPPGIQTSQEHIISNDQTLSSGSSTRPLSLHSDWKFGRLRPAKNIISERSTGIRRITVGYRGALGRDS